MDRRAFFDAVRAKPFRGKLSADQVKGMSAILDQWEARGLTDLRFLAYMLATAFHETARTMLPIKEYGGRAYFMKMYDKTGSRPKVARDLGNTEVGDGALFCGRGYVQLTGRANYAKASQKLGVDFIKSPDLVMDPGYAAQIMFAGMTEGWFTSKKLGDYFKSSHLSGSADWRNARRIINGLDKADTIAGYGKTFHAALLKAEDGKPVVLPRPPDDPGPEPDMEPAIQPAPEAGFSYPEAEGTSVMHNLVSLVIFALIAAVIAEFAGIIDLVPFIGG